LAKKAKHTENPTESLKVEMSKLRVEVETLKKTNDDLCKTLQDPEKGVIVRLTKIETTLSNLKYFIPVGTGIVMLLIQVVLKLAGFL